MKERALFVVLVGIAILLLAYYMPFLTGQASFYYVDHSVFFEPYCRYIGERLAAGQIPLWNPYPGCGQSQVAIASPGLMFPLNWIFAVAPYSVAVSLQMLFHQGLALAAIVLLIKRWNWQDMPAAIAGLIVGFGGYMFSLSQNFTLVSTAAWMLFAVYTIFLARSRQKRARVWGAILGAIATAMMLLSGRPEIWAPGAVLITATALYPLAGQRHAAQLRRSIMSLVPLLAGVLLAMPGLLPTAQWAALSPRSGSLIRPDPLALSMSWYEFIGVIFAQPFGAVTQSGNPFAALSLSARGYQSFVPTFFLGPLAATLALAGLFDKQWRLRWAALSATIVALCIAAGRNLPLLPWLLSVFPMLAAVRYPQKLFFFAQLLIAIMAARGAEFMLRDPFGSRRVWLCAAGGWLIAALAGLVAATNPAWSWFGFHAFAQEHVGGAAGAAVVALGNSIMLWSGIGSIAAFAVASFCCKSARDNASKYTALCSWALVSALSIMLAVVAFLYTRFEAEPSFYSHPSIVADIIDRASRRNSHSWNAVPPRLVQLVPPSGFGMPRSYHAAGKAQDEEAISQYQRQLCMYNTASDFALSSLCPYEGSLTRVPYIIDKVLIEPNVVQPFPEAKQAILARLCQMSSCRFAVSQVWLGSGAKLPLLRSDLFRLLAQNEALNARVYETIEPLPFSYFIQSCNWMPDADAALRSILSTPEHQLDPHDTVILNHGERAMPLGQPKAVRGTRALPVRQLAYCPERMDFELTAPGDGFLVVNDDFYPGWHAYVDGVEHEVLCANAMFKAVAIPAGKHHVSFIFDPAVFKVGYLLAAAGATLIFAWVFALLRGAWLVD